MLAASPTGMLRSKPQTGHSKIRRRHRWSHRSSLPTEMAEPVSISSLLDIQVEEMSPFTIEDLLKDPETPKIKAPVAGILKASTIILATHPQPIQQGPGFLNLTPATAAAARRPQQRASVQPLSNATTSVVNAPSPTGMGKTQLNARPLPVHCTPEEMVRKKSSRLSFSSVVKHVRNYRTHHHAVSGTQKQAKCITHEDASLKSVYDIQVQGSSQTTLTSDPTALSSLSPSTRSASSGSVDTINSGTSQDRLAAETALLSAMMPSRESSAEPSGSPTELSTSTRFESPVESSVVTCAESWVESSVEPLSPRSSKSPSPSSTKSSQHSPVLPSCPETPEEQDDVHSPATSAATPPKPVEKDDFYRPKPPTSPGKRAPGPAPQHLYTKAKQVKEQLQQPSLLGHWDSIATRGQDQLALPSGLITNRPRFSGASTVSRLAAGSTFRNGATGARGSLNRLSQRQSYADKRMSIISMASSIAALAPLISTPEMCDSVASMSPLSTSEEMDPELAALYQAINPVRKLGSSPGSSPVPDGLNISMRSGGTTEHLRISKINRQKHLSKSSYRSRPPPVPEKDERRNMAKSEADPEMVEQAVNELREKLSEFDDDDFALDPEKYRLSIKPVALTPEADPVSRRSRFRGFMRRCRFHRRHFNVPKRSPETENGESLSSEVQTAPTPNRFSRTGFQHSMSIGDLGSPPETLKAQTLPASGLVSSLKGYFK